MAQLFYPLLDISFLKLADYIAGNNKPQFKDNLSATIITGAISPVVFNPLKSLVVTTQNNNFSNMYTSAKYIYGQHGLYGFYKGSPFFMVRNGIFAPCLFVLPNYFENILNCYINNSIATKSISFALSATIAVGATMPMDVYSSLALSDLNKKHTNQILM